MYLEIIKIEILYFRPHLNPIHLLNCQLKINPTLPLNEILIDYSFKNPIQIII